LVKIFYSSATITTSIADILQAAQRVDDYVEAGGLLLPTKRLALMRKPDDLRSADGIDRTEQC
jgi:hypothetical protein